ncbi:MAG TPA: glycoside hydrolase family 3 N-terminal domain-containing protein [Gaiellaceae bacterium]|nr:glycoside hydrolase family 3 N-terminal domain-containing protein [Gaiellaceae bacterium]
MLVASLAATAPARDSAGPALAQLVGQKLVVSMNGTSPSASLLRRVRRGEVGGVIVHRFNFGSEAQLRRITSTLQGAAAAAGRPRLLIAVDQEGGGVKTVPSAPPTLAPVHMGSRAREQGRRTGAALRALGVNVDLAPVADVPASRTSAVYRQGRTWSFDAQETARLAGAFALGLREGGAVAAMKHFPGLGFARRDTDRALVRIRQPRSKLEPGLEPYRSAIRDGVPVVMLSNAIYDAYDPVNAAGWSRAVATTLLRRELGFRGVSTTDSLDGAARVRGTAPNGLAIGAANAGTDLILVTGSEAVTRRVYASLLRAARSGRIGRSTLESSYRRILALKARL